MTPSFGVKLPGLVPTYARTLREIPDLAHAFERMGFDDVMDGEHILFGPVMDHPGGSGNFEHSRTTSQSDRCDSMLMFAAIAARTTTLKFVTGILLGGAYNFAILARKAATLDQLSAGRFTLGIGGGWNGAEFEAMGIPPAERAQRCEENVRACRELWAPGLSSFQGRWINFEDGLTEPAPYTPGGPPVWWGGDGRQRAVARRVATLGDGWLAREAASYDELAASIDNLRAVCAEFGRDFGEIGIRASLTATSEWNAATSFDDMVERAVTRVQRLTAIGVTHFNVPLSYYGVDLDDLSVLLKAVRAA